MGDAPLVHITPTRQGIDASTAAGGPVPVPCIPWSDFAARHAVGRVDLLKVNIEGGEADLLDHIDLGQVERAVVAVHDFRADRGEGEHFRTRERVEARLRGAGFALTPLPQDWIFAARDGR